MDYFPRVKHPCLCDPVAFQNPVGIKNFFRNFRDFQETKNPVGTKF